MTLRRAFAGLAVLAAAWIALPVAAETIAVTARPVPLHPEDDSVGAAGALAYRGGLDLRSRDRRFGGLSALSVESGGRRLLALTDKGRWIRLAPTYGADGRLSGIGEAWIGTLGGLEDGSVAGTELGDSESIARIGRGYAVAFESGHRIWLYPDAEARGFRGPRPLALPPGLRRAPVNGGLEALAALADGRLFALAERLRAGDGFARGWVAEGRRWRPLRYRLAGRFEPAGAARLPGGDVMVLERRFSWLGGFASRVVRLRHADIHPGATLEGTEIAAIEPPLTAENFEGIAARPLAGGGTMIYLVSDDNFFGLQRTLLMMFEYRG